MDRRSHATEAQRRFISILQAINTSDLNGAGEFIWATIVHAVSAADPEHETTGSDRFGNLHRAPSYAETYRQAVARIPAEARKEIDFTACLDIAQRRLHNNFYHLNLSRDELIRNIQQGAVCASQINRLAQQSLLGNGQTLRA